MLACPVCETPVLKCPGIGWYCPDLECAWHDGTDEAGIEAVAEYEQKRRARDRRAYAGMPQEAWLKLLAKTQEDCETMEGVWRALSI